MLVILHRFIHSTCNLQRMGITRTVPVTNTYMLDPDTLITRETIEKKATQI